VDNGFGQGDGSLLGQHWDRLRLGCSTTRVEVDDVLHLRVIVVVKIINDLVFFVIIKFVIVVIQLRDRIWVRGGAGHEEFRESLPEPGYIVSQIFNHRNCYSRIEVVAVKGGFEERCGDLVSATPPLGAFPRLRLRGEG
jgi:hypothetical protein